MGVPLTFTVALLFYLFTFPLPPLRSKPLKYSEAWGVLEIEFGAF